jgi:hypothetical protein
MTDTRSPYQLLALSLTARCVCYRCRVWQAPVCLRFTARSTRRTLGTTEIRRLQRLPRPLTRLSVAVGGVATEIRQRTSARDRLIR